MPIYEYICRKCGRLFERLVWSSDKNPPLCDCGGEGVKTVSTPASISSSDNGCSPAGSGYT